MFARRDLLIGLLLAVAACKGQSSESSAQKVSETATAPKKDAAISLNGAGATFPFPLYSKWIAEYNKLNPNIKINYSRSARAAAFGRSAKARSTSVPLMRR